jgi:hypothetical protein
MRPPRVNTTTHAISATLTSYWATTIGSRKVLAAEPMRLAATAIPSLGPHLVSARRLSVATAEVTRRRHLVAVGDIVLIMTARVDISLLLASARIGVGVLLIAAPTVVLPREDAGNGTNALLMRTVGVRDLVLGGGAVLARMRGRRDEFRRWAGAGLASDTGDLLVGICSARLIGRSGAIKAVAVVAPWVAAGAADLVRGPHSPDAVPRTS